MRIIEATMPKTSDHTGGGLAVVYSASLANVSQISVSLVPFDYELLKVDLKLYQKN